MLNDVDSSDENYHMPTYEEFFNQIKKPLRRRGTESRNKTGKKINELYKKKFDSIKFL